MKYIIYLTTNKINGFIYIGVHKTINPDSFDQYLGCGVYANKPSSYKNPKTAFQFAVNKFGPKEFERKTLFIYDTAKEAYKKEEEIVDIDFIKQDNNYNMVVGGRGGDENEARVVFQFNKSGELVGTWECVKEISEVLGVSINSIYTAIQFKESFKNYFWSWKNQININDFSKGKEKISVYRYTKTGKLDSIYESISEASRSVGITQQDMQAAIKYQQLKHETYYFSTKLYDRFIKSPRKSLKGCKFYLYNDKGTFIQKFENAETLQAYFNLKSWAVLSKAINYNNGAYKNYTITTEYKDNVGPTNYKKQNKPVLVYLASNNSFVGEFESEHKAAKELNCKMSQINRVLRGLAHTHKGYIFKWKVNDIV